MEDPNERANRSFKQLQARHEALIDTMNQFLQYQDENGNKSLKKRDHELGPEELENLSVNEINHGVFVLTDFFNLRSGSAGDINLYKLLQAYLKNDQIRKEINKLLGYF